VYLLSALARVLGSLVALALLVWAVWPRAADAELRATYDRLRASPVPPLLVGQNPPRQMTAEVSPNGYSVSSDVPGIGQVAIVGRAGGTTAQGPLQVRGHPAQLGQSNDRTILTWQEGGAGYTLTLPGRPDERTIQAVAQRVEPLPDAARDALGFPGDTPLLYLAYLPLFVAFAGWASGRLLAQ
jgi:hypothetical protein